MLIRMISIFDINGKNVMVIYLVLLFCTPVEAVDATLASKFILAVFVLFIVVMIIYHCYLKKRLRKSVTNNILSTECDPINKNAFNDKQDVKVSMTDVPESPLYCERHGSLHLYSEV